MIAVVAAALVSATLRAANPILPLWEFVPDGEPHVFEDPDRPGKRRVYLYGSHDTMATGYCGRDLVVWSAPVENPGKWRFDGVAMRLSEDAAGEPLLKGNLASLFYAPDVAVTVKPSGEKTYWFFPHCRTKGCMTMVAKASRPEGPFKVCNWDPADPKRTAGLVEYDPAVFVDDDGRVYGYWGFGKPCGAELDPKTMTATRQGTKIVKDMIGGFKQSGDFRFFEGSSLRKVQGKYVFVYCRETKDGEFGLGNTHYTLAYAYSDTPLGPWTYGGTIIDGRGRETRPDGTTIATAHPSGNTHGSICEIGGKWYVFYHRQTGLDEYSRQAMVAPVEVEVENRPGGKVTISEAEFTSEGFETGGLDPFRRHAAGIACHYTGREAAYETKDEYGKNKYVFSGPYPQPFRCGDVHLRNNLYGEQFNRCRMVHVTDGSVIGYKYFDFSKTHGRTNLKCEVVLESFGHEAKCEIWVVRPSAEEGGVKIGEFSIGKDTPEGLQTFSADVAPLARRKGREALYFVFTSPCKGRSLCELENFRFFSERRPCRDIRFSPLPQGTMLYGDPVRKLDGKPFAKDPTVIRHDGRYLMYYSASGMHESTEDGLVPGAKMGNWCCAIAESKDLVHWRRVGDLVVDGAPFKDGWIAPCVKKLDGKIHLFAQYPRPGSENLNPLMRHALWHATSDDGIHFKFAVGNPIFAPKNAWSNGRAIDADVWRSGNSLILAYASRDKATEERQIIGLASAPFGSDYGADKWTEITSDKPLFEPDMPWEMNCIEAATVVRHKDIWYMFYAGAFNHERQQIGLAWSADGIHFKRWSDKPVLPHGTEGSWNAWESGHPGVFKDDDGQIYLFYQGKATLDGTYRLSCLKVEFVD